MMETKPTHIDSESKASRMASGCPMPSLDGDQLSKHIEEMKGKWGPILTVGLPMIIREPLWAAPGGAQPASHASTQPTDGVKDEEDEDAEYVVLAEGSGARPASVTNNGHRGEEGGGSAPVSNDYSDILTT